LVSRRSKTILSKKGWEGKRVKKLVIYKSHCKQLDAKPNFCKINLSPTKILRPQVLQTSYIIPAMVLHFPTFGLHSLSFD
jgi:hypothetical protein